ncbi:putative C6 transcription factor [Xylaria sp. FL1777]|nr:putative C6 transcription factor [Xylaria sp. FL1777]
MAGRQLVPLQPKPSPLGEEDPDPDSQSSKHRKGRVAILVACEPCRRLKAKCDGERPTCRRCRNKGQDCVYELPQDAQSRSSGRKEIASRLHRENLELRQLFHDLSKRPEPEAYDIFQRLRSADDPISLAHSIRQAELLLPLHASEDRGEFPTLQQLDIDALEASPIKVPARPWTTVAGDGIVSELISAWFKWDNTFLYPFIDRECFTKDICVADPVNATYCSPFLVNTICAYRSYFSDTVDTAERITKQNMREQFLAESIKHSDHGTPTLPTIQGLWIMFSISYLKGEDKNGSLYRFASYGMLKRSRMNQIYPSLSDTDKRAISKTVWGVFCLESIIATNFHNTDILQPPEIPCLFPEFNRDSPTNIDIFGQPFISSSPQPPFVTGAISVFCVVAMLVSEVLTYGQGQKDNEETDSTDRAHLIKRNEFMTKLNAINDSLPSALRHDYNFTPATCFLRIVMNTAAHAILRPLHPDFVLDETDGTTVKDTMLKNCELDIELMENYFARWTTGEFSTMAFVGPLNSGMALLPLLPQEAASQLFPRICRLMRNLSTRMPIAKYVLKGWEAALWSRKIEIPGPAKPYFENLGTRTEELLDIPTSLLVTHVPKFEDVLSEEWDDGKLGFLLQKWSEMSIG